MVLRRLAARAGERPGTGIEYAFADAPDELLATDPGCWTLEPDAPWHGFGA
jgi:arginine decarboxylase